MKPFAIVLVLVCLATLPAQAQLGIYGQFDTSTITIANTPRLYGGTFGVFYDSERHKVVNLGIDVRGNIQSATQNSVQTTVTSVSAGPRVAFHVPVIPLHPYGELLAGGAHVQVGQGLALYDSSGFSATAAVGADLHILPFVSWRVLDYSFSRVPHANQSTISTGLVIRIPFS